MRYNYEFKEERFNFIRMLLLTIFLFFDLLNVVTFVSGIITSWYFILLSGFVFLVLLLFRYLTTFLIYTLEYKYENQTLTIIKIYAYHSFKKLEVKKSDIECISEDYKIEKNSNLLCPKSCKDNIYMLKLKNGEKFIVSLDDMMYANLTCEEEYDLFR